MSEHAEYLKQMLEQLDAAWPKAIETLQGLMESDDPKIRLQAAKALRDMKKGLKARIDAKSRESGLERRIRAIEEKLGL